MTDLPRLRRPLLDLSDVPTADARAGRLPSELRSYKPTWSDYGRQAANFARGLVTAAPEAIVDAAEDPTSSKITRAGAQTALAFGKPLHALGLGGIGLLDALRKDTGALDMTAQAAPLEAADVLAGDDLNDYNRLKKLPKPNAASKARLKGYNERILEAARIRAEKEAEAATAGQRLEAEGKAKEEAMKREEFERKVMRAERIRDQELARQDRFADTNAGEWYRENAGWLPFAAAFGGGALSRLATGPGKDVAGKAFYDWILPTVAGSTFSYGAQNAPEIYDFSVPPALNPEREAYIKAAFALPDDHPDKKAWDEYGRAQPMINPVKTAAVQSFKENAPARMTAAALEGFSLGKIGAGMVNLPRRLAKDGYEKFSLPSPSAIKKLPGPKSGTSGSLSGPSTGGSSGAGKTPYTPDQSSSVGSYKDLPPLYKDALRGAYRQARTTGPVKPGPAAKAYRDDLDAAGFNVPVSAARVKRTNEAVEAFERSRGRLPKGPDWSEIFTDKTLAVPLAATAGLGALADRDEYADGGMVVIRSKGGAPFRVAAPYAPRFQGLIDDLEASGYSIDPKQSGGYNKRFIDGTKTPSLHSYGRAIDINWTDNARGKPGQIPESLAKELAAKHGLNWGGVWANRDDMHFEVPFDNTKVANRGLTTFAGLAAPKADATAVAAGSTPADAADAMMDVAEAAESSKPSFDLDKIMALMGGGPQAPAAPPPMQLMAPPPIQVAQIEAPIPYQTTAFANGGSVGEPVTVGPLHSRVPGRTDHLAITVPEGAYVVPADVVAALGEGNSTAGLDRVGEMFPSPRQLRANGGKVPIAAAGGEYVIDPDTVAQIGGGDMKRGHERLDQFVVQTRKQHINHLKRLPRPEK